MLSHLRRLASKLLSMREEPLIVVLGATATGKSQLAVDIALRYNGEVISTDSMQVYKGLDIITNKVTTEEMKGVKHHLIDFVEPPAKITVVDFKDRAVKAIESIRQSGKLPVLVGGTNYYIESVLWDVLIDSGERNSDQGFLLQREEMKAEKASNHPDTADLLNCSNIFDHQIHAKSFRNIPSNHLYNILDQLDHESAVLFHPSDKRKIIRALQVYQQTAVKYSEHLARQRARGGCLGGPLRYRNVICLWTRSEANILKERINKRVYTMIQNGLLQELETFHRMYNQQRLLDDASPETYTSGIFQSIGFKEFHSYLTCKSQDEDKRNKLLTKCIEELKVATRKYARVQEKWIRNRFIHAGDRDVPLIYSIDTSYPEKWNETVLNPVFQLLDNLLYKQNVVSPLKPEEKKARKITSNHIFFCQLCQQHVHGDISWSSHLKSKKHLALSKGKKREEEEQVNTAHESEKVSSSSSPFEG